MKVWVVTCFSSDDDTDVSVFKDKEKAKNMFGNYLSEWMDDGDVDVMGNDYQTCMENGYAQFGNHGWYIYTMQEEEVL